LYPSIYSTSLSRHRPRSLTSRRSHGTAASASPSDERRAVVLACGPRGGTSRRGQARAPLSPRRRRRHHLRRLLLRRRRLPRTPQTTRGPTRALPRRLPRRLWFLPAPAGRLPDGVRGATTRRTPAPRQPRIRGRRRRGGRRGRAFTRVFFSSSTIESHQPTVKHPPGGHPGRACVGVCVLCWPYGLAMLTGSLVAIRVELGLDVVGCPRLISRSSLKPLELFHLIDTSKTLKLS